MGIRKHLGVAACAMAAVFGFGLAQAANPLTTDFYSADAAALVYNDSLFIFAGHDEQGPEGANNKFFLMNDWHVMVTDDMENYHDYGAVLSYKTFKWADMPAPLQGTANIVTESSTGMWPFITAPSSRTKALPLVWP